MALSQSGSSGRVITRIMPINKHLFLKKTPRFLSAGRGQIRQVLVNF
jgi:hypothetical protein